MASNIKAMKGTMMPNGAMAYMAVPPGWTYDNVSDRYYDIQGRFIENADITKHGTLISAITAIHGGNAVIQNRSASTTQAVTPPTSGSYATHSHGQQPANPSFGDLWTDTLGHINVYTQQGWVPVSGNLSAASVSAANIPVPAGSITNGQWAPVGVKIGVGHPSTNIISIETKLGRISVDTETGDLTVPVGVGRVDAIREFWFGFQEHFRPSNNEKYDNQIAHYKEHIETMKRHYEESVAYHKKDASAIVAEKIRKKYNGEKFIMIKPEDLIKFIEEA